MQNLANVCRLQTARSTRRLCAERSSATDSKQKAAKCSLSPQMRGTCAPLPDLWPVGGQLQGKIYTVLIKKTVFKIVADFEGII